MAPAETKPAAMILSHAAVSLRASPRWPLLFGNVVPRVWLVTRSGTLLETQVLVKDNIPKRVKATGPSTLTQTNAATVATEPVRMLDEAPNSFSGEDEFALICAATLSLFCNALWDTLLPR